MKQPHKQLCTSQKHTRRKGTFYLWGKKEHEQAIAEAEQALTLNPNFAQAYADLGNLLIYAGQPEAAIERIEQAMRPAIPCERNSRGATGK